MFIVVQFSIRICRISIKLDIVTIENTFVLYDILKSPTKKS